MSFILFLCEILLAKMALVPNLLKQREKMDVVIRKFLLLVALWALFNVKSIFAFPTNVKPTRKARKVIISLFLVQVYVANAASHAFTVEDFIYLLLLLFRERHYRA